MKVVLIILGSILLLSSCASEEISVPVEESTLYLPHVQAELIPHISTFVTEASQRGIRIDIESFNLSGEIVAISEDRVAGQCTYGSHIAPEIIIDQNFWNSASTSYREYVVFHELGHCILSQDHREGCRADRTYSSLMRSGLGSCRDNYTTSTRDYYLDELFNASSR